MRTSKLGYLTSIAVLLAGAACSTQREPTYVAPGLVDAGIDTISVAPIIDARSNKFRDVVVLADIRKAVDGTLSQKGYGVIPAQLSRGGVKLGADEIAGMSQAELARIAPPDVRFLLLISVESVTRGVGELGRTVDIKLSGRLLDTSNGRELWRDTAEGDADLGGLLTVLTGPGPDNEAAYDAARTLFSTLPDGPQRRGGSTTKVPAEVPAVKAPVEGMRPPQEY